MSSNQFVLLNLKLGVRTCIHSVCLACISMIFEPACVDWLTGMARAFGTFEIVRKRAKRMYYVERVQG